MRQNPRDAAAEALLLLGGARAILLQLANPAVGHGVAEHSDFTNRPLDRLRGTLTYLYVIVYGTTAEKARIARWVGRAHEPVRGEGYDARDVHLQVWVAATIHETGRRMYELVFGPIDAATRQAMLDASAAVATTLGVPRALWPTTPEAFAAYWSRELHGLRVDDASRAVAQALLHPVHAPWWFRLALPGVRTLTAGLLSPELRAAYELPHDERRYRRLVQMLRAVYPRLPLALRQAPKRHYLRKFRASAPS